MGRILVIGAGGHAQVILDIIEKDARHSMVGFFDVTLDCDRELAGYCVFSAKRKITEIVQQECVDFLVVGIGDNSVRARVALDIKKLLPDMHFASLVHPSAYIGKGVKIESGTVIMAGAIVNPYCHVGSHCIINSAASFDHHSVMGDFSSLAPGVVVGGNCRIGHYTAIGIGATLLHGMMIGKDTIVGAGSLVLNHLGDSVLAYGHPAKIIRERQHGEKYL